ncbi:hypothetical protein OIO90_003798 [Microbotryomycetes sp. JL221]|nr:hypothetical protein OIO90_003798 [Microbotryomycetes sp. JL221]
MQGSHRSPGAHQSLPTKRSNRSALRQLEGRITDEELEKDVREIWQPLKWHDCPGYRAAIEFRVKLQLPGAQESHDLDATLWRIEDYIHDLASAIRERVDVDFRDEDERTSFWSAVRHKLTSEHETRIANAAKDVDEWWTHNPDRYQVLVPLMMRARKHSIILPKKLVKAFDKRCALERPPRLPSGSTQTLTELEEAFIYFQVTLNLERELRRFAEEIRRVVDHNLIREQRNPADFWKKFNKHDVEDDDDRYWYGVGDDTNRRAGMYVDGSGGRGVERRTTSPGEATLHLDLGPSFQIKEAHTFSLAAGHSSEARPSTAFWPRARAGRYDVG